MTPEGRLSRLNTALGAVGNYLEACGWAMTCASFAWIDPLTGFPHRTDIAFMIQTDREAAHRPHPAGQGTPPGS